MKHFDAVYPERSRGTQCKQKGQIILILIMVMTVALGIGLSIVQKSLVDISTASKVEQSSRAFSAAEAGVEKALQENTNCQNCKDFTDNSSSIKEITGTDLIPPAATAGNRQVALEFPPLAKEDVVQVWLADYTSSSNPPQTYYNQNRLDVYWGATGIIDPDNKPAIEIKVIYFDGSYQVKPFYLDSNSSRVASNGFTNASGDCTSPTITTTSGSNRQFFCRSSLSGLTLPLMLIRVRLLYSSISQPLAVQAGVTCPTEPCAAYSLPAQAKEIISTGVSGETQRKVKVFLLNKVVPPFFDYAIFSAGEINKQ
ncbi:MAG: Uncharacterized protein G01um10147_607 [Microgenomates group bacterium Gr01-1014_7]|nr:MAG: Uncharacterized protein G01um10147_607 [Microgenomates group bacterium Gr01-1014_7]